MQGSNSKLNEAKQELQFNDSGMVMLINGLCYYICVCTICC